MTNTDKEHKERRLYGRRQNRPLNGTRKEAIDTLLPKLEIKVETLDKPASIKATDLFDEEPENFWLEIGFGSGEHLTGLIQRHPDTHFIGVEPFVNGMASFLRDIKDLPHDKVRVLMDDAILLTEALEDDCLDGIYVLNPDPWPKTRHHKRRIISQRNLDQFARLIKPGGQLIMATDVDDLAEWMVTQATRHSEFEWTAESADDWRIMPEDWIKTRYEEKGSAADRQQSYLIFERV